MDDERIEEAAKAMFEYERLNAQVLSLGWDTIPKNYGKDGIPGQAHYRDMARHALSTVNNESDRLERFARVAMLGALAIELIPYIQGVEAAAAYEKWSNTWVTTLTSTDMTYARGVVGLPEPD